MAYSDNTLRLNILEYIKGLFEAATDDPNPPTGRKNYGIEFSTVRLGPLSSEDNRKRFAVGIIPGNENKSDLFPLKTALLPITIEFRVTVNRGDPDPLVMAERVLGVAQQIILDDRDFGGLILYHSEMGNEQDMFTYSDKAISGMVQFQVHYRHAIDNVYDGQPV